MEFQLDLWQNPTVKRFSSFITNGCLDCALAVIAEVVHSMRKASTREQLRYNILLLNELSCLLLKAWKEGVICDGCEKSC